MHDPHLNRPAGRGDALYTVVDSDQPVETDRPDDDAQDLTAVSDRLRMTPSRPPICAQFIYEQDGFLSFRTGYRLDVDSEIEQAAAVPLEFIERAFINNWDRHENVLTNRSQETLRHQAYDLSFGSDEQRRIRDSLPADSEILSLIECFGSQVLLENFSRYLNKRRSFFRLISDLAAIVSFVVAAIAWVFLSLPVVSAAAGLIGTASSSWQAVAAAALPAGVFAFVFALVGSVVTRFLWLFLIAHLLKHQRSLYRSSVQGSTSRMKGHITRLQQSFVSLSVSAQKQLTDLKRREDDFVDTASKFVRLIVWFPVRLLMIETFYRAVVDSYMENSAKLVLAADMRIFARMELRRYAWRAAAFCGAASLLYIWNQDLASALAIAPIICAVGLTSALWWRRDAKSSAHFIPKDVSGFQFDLARRRAIGAFLGSLPYVATLCISAAMVSSGSPAWGEWDINQIGRTYADLTPFALTAGVAGIGIALLQNIVARQVYIREKTRKNFNGNIVEDIRPEMDSANWSAFNELRSDLKMAEIYESVFSALQEERKKRA